MHSMRLRSPWQVDRGDGVFQRCELPDSKQSEGPTIAYRRSFNCPTGLESTDKVWLIIHGWEGRIESLSVNGQLLDMEEHESPTRLEISTWLLRSNRIELILAATGEVGSRLTGPVELAIESLP
ncbi:MAG: hypothetical protein AAGG48_09070 [Planctomycetota bacterium]